MATLHVWKNSPAPNANRRFPTKLSAAHTIGAALAIARAGETIIVHGDCGANRCKYKENVVITIPGLTMAGREWPIIDGGGAGRTVDINTNSRRIVTLDSFEILGGKTPANGAGVRVHECAAHIVRNCIHHNEADKGGGIAVERKSNLFPVTIENNHIHRNKAKFHGGGIFQLGDSTIPSGVPPILITENLIHHNRGGTGGGGFVHGGGIGIFRDTSVIRHNHIYKNRTNGGEHYGGGVAVFNVDENQGPAPFAYLFGLSWSSIAISQALLEHNLIEENTSHDGGGVSGLWAASLVYKRNTIRKNTSTDDAGGIYGSVVAHHRLEEGNLIDNNSTREFGGGLHLTCSSRLEITAGNIISNNSASRESGGGISIRNGELNINGPALIQGNTCKGKGGGIYVWTMNLPTSFSFASVGFQLCEMDSEAIVDGAIIEGNTSQFDGGGMCVEKAHWLTRVRLTKVLNSIFRSNRSTATRFAGLAILADANARSGFTPVVEGNLFENHTTPRHATAVLVRGVANTTITPRFNSNLVRSNGAGLELGWTKGGMAKGNHFHGQREFQIRSRNSSLAASSNELDGNGQTSVGIENPTIIPAGRMDFIWGGNITGHANFGVWSPIARKDAIGNWWGNAQGPKVPGGQQPAGADTVSPRVQWNPPSGGAAQLRLPTGPVIAPPTPTPPPAVGFSMPSEVYKGLDCGRAGPAGAPGTYIPPSEDERSRLESGRSNSGKKIGSSKTQYLDRNGELHEAMASPGGDLVLIDSDGAAEGILTVEGYWYPATKSLGRSIENDQTSESDQNPNTIVFVERAKNSLEVALPKASFVDLKEKLPAQWRLLHTTSCCSSPKTKRSKSSEIECQVAISFAGWPLLLAKGKKNQSLDLAGVNVSIDSSFQSVKISQLPSDWSFTLQLPIDDGWNMPLEPNAEIKTFVKEGKRKPQTLSLPLTLGKIKGSKKINIHLLNEGDADHTRVLTVENFKGGELKILREIAES
ncbi:hypothetical protein MLD52_10560 [Puniceicoccaceae bacterium K14]|nr:hypothetical protein [Puniceicoccaceae bacterium K14]